MIVTGSLCHAGGSARPVPSLCILISPGPWPPVLPGDKINDTPFTALPDAQTTEWPRRIIYVIKTVVRGTRVRISSPHESGIAHGIVRLGTEAA